MPNVIRTTASGSANVDALTHDFQWATTTLSYGFPTSGADYGSGYPTSDPGTNFAALNVAQRGAATAAFTAVQSFTNLRFSEATGASAGAADLRLGLSDATGTAFAFLPSPSAAGGDAWFNNSSGFLANPRPGDYAYFTFLHELGHTLGLEHGHDVLSADRDSIEYTVMTYRGYIGAPLTGYVNGSGGFSQSYMMLDIAALQHMYGANYGYNAGNNIYRWSPTTGAMSIDGVAQATPVANKILTTIWDGGGTDTYDLSAYAGGVTVDLRPGEFSTTAANQLANLGRGNSARGNVANALLHGGDTRSLIENAIGGAGADRLTGNDAANRLEGGGGADLLLSGSGEDVLIGGDGNDALLFGAFMSAGDSADGGAGDDQLGLQGNYTGLVLGADDLVGIETLALLSGADTRFGDTAGNFYSYAVATVDANVAAGGKLIVNYNQLRAGENVVFDGGLERDGTLFVYAGLGIDRLTGGAANDAFFFGEGARFQASDRIDGGAGDDQVGLRGSAAVVFQASTISNVETIALLSSSDVRFASGGSNFGYDLTIHDGNTAAGAQLTVNGGLLAVNETIRFDGSAETDGSFRLFGGRGADVLTGGAGGDTLYGNLGADRLTGEAGGDVFLYFAPAESTGAGFDTLVGFDAGADRLDLPGDVAGFADSLTDLRLTLATIDADLTLALAGRLGAGSAALLAPSGGDLAGRIFVATDGNGVAGWQPGEDYLIELSALPVPITTDIFV